MNQANPMRSEKHEAGRQRVPIELQRHFDEFVADFQFFSLKHYGRQFVSYEIIADMVMAGWVPPAENSR